MGRTHADRRSGAAPSGALVGPLESQLADTPESATHSGHHMKYMLSRQNREIIAQLAWSNVLLAFDFDGTLSPIVTIPEQARMRARTRRLFGLVSQRYPCVVISGRAAADVAARLGDANVRAVVG